jgi:hypothetical protein
MARQQIRKVSGWISWFLSVVARAIYSELTVRSSDRAIHYDTNRVKSHFDSLPQVKQAEPRQTFMLQQAALQELALQHRQLRPAHLTAIRL